MPLWTNNKPATIDPAGFTVAFGMFDGANEIGCRISSEALQDRFGAGGTAVDLVSAFSSNRYQIEAAASRKFDLGQTSNGLVFLTSPDV